MKYKTLLLTGLITLITFSYFNRPPPCPLNAYPRTIVSINQHQLYTEVANTEPARQCGLAFRKNLPDNSAMLFIFDEAQLLKFWMKDTLIPITVAYISENKAILAIHHMRPEQRDKVFYSKEKALYALEASPEWFSDNKISVGDKVKFNIQ